MTRISGTTIIKAPCCGALLATPSYASINFTAWEHWTDGYAERSLAPTHEGLMRCICGQCFLLGASHRVSTVPRQKPPPPDGWEGWSDNWWSRVLGRESREQILERDDVRSAALIEAEQKSLPPSPKNVSSTELPALIESEVADIDVVETARRLYWRHLNEPFRDVYRAFREAHAVEVDAEGTSATFPEYLPSPLQILNMQQLVTWSLPKLPLTVKLVGISNRAL